VGFTGPDLETPEREFAESGYSSTDWDQQFVERISWVGTTWNDRSAPAQTPLSASGTGEYDCWE
jgi:hypothetical protein